MSNMQKQSKLQSNSLYPNISMPNLLVMTVIRCNREHFCTKIDINNKLISSLEPSTLKPNTFYVIAQIEFSL